MCRSLSTRGRTVADKYNSLFKQYDTKVITHRMKWGHHAYKPRLSQWQNAFPSSQQLTEIVAKQDFPRISRIIHIKG